MRFFKPKLQLYIKMFLRTWKTRIMTSSFLTKNITVPWRVDDGHAGWSWRKKKFFLGRRRNMFASRRKFWSARTCGHKSVTRHDRHHKSVTRDDESGCLPKRTLTILSTKKDTDNRHDEKKKFMGGTKKVLIFLLYSEGSEKFSAYFFMSSPNFFWSFHIKGHLKK